MTHLYKRNLNRKLWLCTGLVVGIAASFSQPELWIRKSEVIN